MNLSSSAIALLGLTAWPLLLMFLIINQRGLLVLGGVGLTNLRRPV